MSSESTQSLNKSSISESLSGSKFSRQASVSWTHFFSNSLSVSTILPPFSVAACCRRYSKWERFTFLANRGVTCKWQISHLDYQGHFDLNFINYLKEFVITTESMISLKWNYSDTFISASLLSSVYHNTMVITYLYNISTTTTLISSWCINTEKTTNSLSSFSHTYQNMTSKQPTIKKGVNDKVLLVSENNFANLQTLLKQVTLVF